ARLRARGACGRALRLELLGAAVARVRFALAQQALDLGGVRRRALALEERSLVPRDLQPLEAFEDRVDRRLRRAFAIGVLDAQDEDAAVSPRVQIVEQCGARAAYMKVAARTRCEASSRWRRMRHCVKIVAVPWRERGRLGQCRCTTVPTLPGS